MLHSKNVRKTQMKQVLSISMKKRLLLLWALLIAFAGMAVFWMLHVPYKPERMYRLVPHNAEFVSTHIELASRWEDFYGNPVSRGLLGAIDDDLFEWGDDVHDPDFNYWMDKLLGRRTVFAYIPSTGMGGAPAWIGVSWLGGEGIKLRWLLKRGRMDGLTRQDRHAGGTFWRVESDPEDSEYLSIAIVEGMIVAAWSADPDAVKYAMDSYDGRIRSIADNEEPYLDSPGCSDNALDWGWYNPGYVDTAFLPLYFQFERIDKEGLIGALSVAGDDNWYAMPDDGIEQLGQLMGPLPFIVAGAHPDGFWELWSKFAPYSWQESADRYLRNIPLSGPVTLSVMSGEHGGRLFGIGVPSLLLGAYVGEDDSVLEAVKNTLDHLNARYRWGLVPHMSMREGRSLYVIEGTADTAYSRFRFNDQIAFTLHDGWFLAASHAAPLMKLMSRYENVEAVVKADDGPWRAGLEKSDAAAYGWMDLTRGATAVRGAIMAYSVKLLFDDPVETQDTRQRLNDIIAWVNAFEPMLRMHLWLEGDGEKTTVRFELGS